MRCGNPYWFRIFRLWYSRIRRKREIDKYLPVRPVGQPISLMYFFRIRESGQESDHRRFARESISDRKLRNWSRILLKISWSARSKAVLMVRKSGITLIMTISWSGSSGISLVFAFAICIPESERGYQVRQVFLQLFLSYRRMLFVTQITGFKMAFRPVSSISFLMSCAFFCFSGA